MTNSYDRKSDRKYDPTGHLMTVKTTVDSTGGPIVRLIQNLYPTLDYGQKLRDLNPHKIVYSN